VTASRSAWSWIRTLRRSSRALGVKREEKGTEVGVLVNQSSNILAEGPCEIPPRHLHVIALSLSHQSSVWILDLDDVLVPQEPVSLT
jgi:hypothetical protein